MSEDNLIDENQIVTDNTTNPSFVVELENNLVKQLETVSDDVSQIIVQYKNIIQDKEARLIKLINQAIFKLKDIDNKMQKINAFSNEIDIFQEKITNLTNSIDPINDKLNSLKDKILLIDEKITVIDKFDASKEKLTEEVQALHDSISRTEQREADKDRSYRQMKKTFESTEATFEQLKEEINEVRNSDVFKLIKSGTSKLKEDIAEFIRINYKVKHETLAKYLNIEKK